MTERALVIETYRLIEDGYSVPKGSIGFPDQDSMCWLPPLHGRSSPLILDHYERAGELVIPMRLIAGAIS